MILVEKEHSAVEVFFAEVCLTLQLYCYRTCMNQNHFIRMHSYHIYCSVFFKFWSMDRLY